MNPDLQDGAVITLVEARRRFGKLTRAPLGGLTTYLEVAVEGGVWRPWKLDFFGGVVAYRFFKLPSN